ncbi:MAG: hypothetical protein M3511_08910 [Deinococcota bacterium]|jgi:hypothetical protein|nr:hypothetical protein [Deinococcota bacterium]
MPEGSPQERLMREFMRDPTLLPIFCPPERDIPGVQVFCGAWIGEGHYFLSYWERRAEALGLEAETDTWLYAERFMRNYSNELGLFRVIYALDWRSGPHHVTVQYTPR